MPLGKSLIDPTSRFFIITEALFGMNRVALLQKFSNNQKIVSNVFTTIWTTFTIALAIYFAYTLRHISRMFNFCEYILTCTISYLFIDRLRLFYKYIDKFDHKFGRKPECSGNYKYATLLFILIPIAMNTYNVTMVIHNSTGKLESLTAIVVAAIHNSEFFYYSYLQSMVTSRIGLIIEKVEMKLQARNDAYNAPFSDTEMRKFFKFYNILIKAFDKFGSAIKWQFCVMLLLPFTSYLMYFVNQVNTYIMYNKLPATGVFGWVLLAARNLGLIIPLCCISLHADWLHQRVLTLRSSWSVYKHRYEDVFDTKSRELVSTLITLTETRDFSLILFGMANVNAALPFKLISSFVTYLMILLQFRKVIPAN